MILYLNEFAVFLEKQINFYHIVKFIGNKLTAKLLNDPEEAYCRKLISIFKMGGGLIIKDVMLPAPVNQSDEWTIGHELVDILLPYLFEQNRIIFDDSFYDEGPYEMENISLKQNDIVLDCGASIGMFSALASL